MQSRRGYVSGPHIDRTGAKAIVFRTSNLDAVTSHLENQGAIFEWKLKLLSADGLQATMVRNPDGTIINILQYPLMRSPETTPPNQSEDGWKP
jgi:hypothetical protein